MKPGWAPDSIDRAIAGISAIGGLLLLVFMLPLVYVPFAGGFAWWWNALGLVWAALTVALSALSWVMPVPSLRRLIAVHCAWFVLLLGSSFLAAVPATGIPFDRLTPWPWAVAPAPAAMLCMLLGRRAALTVTGVIAVLPALSAWVFRGVVPADVLTMTPVAIGTGIIVVMAIAIRERLANLYRAENVVRLREELEHQERVSADQQEQFLRSVHDRVLATLTAVTRFTGVPPAVLRDEARKAVRLLEDAPGRSSLVMIPRAAVAALLEAESVRIAPQAAVTVVSSEGSYPSTILAPVTAALGEAVRNAVRHAGPAARVSVEITARERLSVVVADTGVGFDPAAVDPSRLGIRQSIVRRMHDLPGGHARIESGRTGTRISLWWAE